MTGESSFLSQTLQSIVCNLGVQVLYLWISFSRQMCELFKQVPGHPILPFYYQSSLLTVVPLILDHYQDA